MTPPISTAETIGKRRFFVLGRGGEYRALEENEEAKEKRLSPLLERRATEARVKRVDWTENMVMAYSSSEMSKSEIYRETLLMKREGETKPPRVNYYYTPCLDYI